MKITLSRTASSILKERYLLRDNNRRIIETPEELFRRVAHHISLAERNFKKSRYTPSRIEEIFFKMLSSLDFLPNSPTLMNAGTPIGQLSACFVLPVEDSMESIFTALKNMAIIHQSGGGTGFNFSHLRPRDDLVESTKGRASGPVSFMEVFNTATGTIIQGGRRRGANMGILRCDHPDIIEFIKAKRDKNAFQNFNLSVAITDRFIQALKKRQKVNLINPNTGRAVMKVSATTIWHQIAVSVWECGDPGVIFIDRINRYNPTPLLGRIESTNPCGELPLLPYESCNLGSINLSHMVEGGSINWNKLADTVRFAVRFLDNVIEVNRYPLPEIERMTKGNRKIGLGVMGFADLLIKLGIPYASPEAIRIAGKIMKFIKLHAHQASIELARERGIFPNYRYSIFYKKGIKIRNATCTTIAPTGSISIIAGCSSGIEPLFAISYIRSIMGNKRFLEVNPLFISCIQKEGLFSEDLLRTVTEKGTVRETGLPKHIKSLFATAFEIPPYQHLLIQSAFQRFTDNSVSKTINLPEDTTINKIKQLYLSAYRLGCKGVTLYRYGSKEDQVLSLPDTEYSGGCIGKTCHF